MSTKSAFRPSDSSIATIYIKLNKKSLMATTKVNSPQGHRMWKLQLNYAIWTH